MSGSGTTGRSRSPVRRAVAAAIALGGLTLVAAPAAAWDALGHRVVAAIAWEELSPAVRAEVTRLLSAAPPDSDLPALMPAGGSQEKRRRELFLAASTWPDIVRDRDHPQRRDAYHRSNWHYINYFWEQGPETAPRERTDLSPQPTNVVERLEALAEVLGDPGADPAERGIAAAWILHLVGDLHQPLHTSARVTEREPEGDRGGNLFHLDAEGDDNLHYYWDSILRRATPWWLRWRLSEDRLARELAAEHPAPPGSELEADFEADFEAWAREGFATARQLVYPPTLRRGREPSYAYRKVAREAASEAIARAGHRLAAVLETALE